ncbi:hypothetical protein PybrP1_001864 [[Pythium] brassicae (nom. inval.)]|nr:hypothetical protein PybrP1_001864 [[Pythium] brassicae (nom. inval.)]
MALRTVRSGSYSTELDAARSKNDDLRLEIAYLHKKMVEKCGLVLQNEWQTHLLSRRLWWTLTQSTGSVHLMVTG